MPSAFQGDAFQNDAFQVEIPIVRATVRVDAELSAGVWTSLRDDLSAAAESFTWRRGMAGGGPADTVARTGTCEFSLKNWAATPRRQGWYSPNHANVRSGWTFGIAIRIVATYASIDRTLWRGRLRTIDPLPGQYGAQRVRCLAHDFMGDLAEAEVQVAIQIDQSEVQCLQAIIAAMPADAQPAATSYDTALETFPWALDNLASGARALTGVIDVGNSCQGQIFVSKDGTFTYKNRHTWATDVSDFTFTESQLERDDGIEVPSDLAGVWNDVTASAHPKSVSAAIVLCGITSAVLVGAGQTIELFLDYRAPNNEDRLIGGKNFTTPLVENTDYDARANADGTGADLSANLTVTVSPFAATAKFTVTNTGATGAYLVNGSGTPLLQLRGDGLLDNQPDRRRSVSTKPYGSRKLPIDLPYQNDGAMAADAAAFNRARYENLSDKVLAVRVNPQRSDALMIEVLTAEIGDVKTTTETMTGVSAVNVIVVGFEFEVGPGDWLMVRYVTAPASPFKMWQLGTAGASELGETTVFGY